MVEHSRQRPTCYAERVPPCRAPSCTGSATRTGDHCSRPAWRRSRQQRCLTPGWPGTLVVRSAVAVAVAQHPASAARRAVSASAAAAAAAASTTISPRLYELFVPDRLHALADVSDVDAGSSDPKPWAVTVCRAVVLPRPLPVHIGRCAGCGVYVLRGDSGPPVGGISSELGRTTHDGQYYDHSYTRQHPDREP